jgi:hypothetical protein
MRVSVSKDIESDVTTMTLEPQSERDYRVLERILSDYVTAGFGCDPDTDEITHVEIKLTPKG